MRKLVTAAAIAAACLLGTAAQAAQTLTITGPSGTYGDDEVVCGNAAAPCAFSRTFEFVTPTGFNLASADISSVATLDPMTDLSFGTVTLNGVNFDILSTGQQEFRNLLNQALVAGGTNRIVVNGTTGGNAAFSGTLSFAAAPAVPEPSTWLMMLLGFGVVGSAMRRRQGLGALQTA